MASCRKRECCESRPSSRLVFESNRKLDPDLNDLVSVQSRRRSEDTRDLEGCLVQLRVTGARRNSPVQHPPHLTRMV